MIKNIFELVLIQIVINKNSFCLISYKTGSKKSNLDLKIWFVNRPWNLEFKKYEINTPTNLFASN